MFTTLCSSICSFNVFKKLCSRSYEMSHVNVLVVQLVIRHSYYVGQRSLQSYHAAAAAAAVRLRRCCMWPNRCSTDDPLSLCYSPVPKLALARLPVLVVANTAPIDFCIYITFIRALHFSYILLNVYTAVLLFNRVHCFCVPHVCPASHSLCTNLIANSRAPDRERGRKLAGARRGESPRSRRRSCISKFPKASLTPSHPLTRHLYCTTECNSYIRTLVSTYYIGKYLPRLQTCHLWYTILDG